MKAGRIPYPPDAPINFGLNAFEEEQLMQLTEIMWRDELLFGKCGAHVGINEDGILSLRPLTSEEWDKIKGDQFTRKMSLEEIIEQFPLTEDQIKQLKDFRDERK